MIIRVIDFETTSLPPEASVCEAAFVDVDTDAPAIGSAWHALVKPTTPMTIEARAVHHITDVEIEQDGIDWGQAQAVLTHGEPVAYAAHNAEFEQAFFAPDGAQWIDTWKVGLRLWPDAPSHSNQVLRYFLDLDLGDEAMPPHRALPDAWVTAHILAIALGAATLADLIEWSREPAYLTKLNFGKHRGSRFADVPRDYLEWITRQQDMDAAVLAAARRELAAR